MQYPVGIGAGCEARERLTPRADANAWTMVYGIGLSMRRSRAVIGIPVPHQLAFLQQHVAAEADHLIACFLLGSGIRDEHLAEQSAALDVGKREGDSYPVRCRRRCGAARSAARDGQEH